VIFAVGPSDLRSLFPSASIGVAAASADAVYRVTGSRIRSLPIALEKVLR